MFELLYKYNGNLLVNGKEYKSVYEADKEFGTKNGGLTIVLNPGGKRELNNSTQTSPSRMLDPNKFYQISVMSYMTNYKDDFFLATSPQIKNTSPMPFMVMVGRVLDETNKLVKMQLRADRLESKYTRCMRCGRPISDKVYQLFGMGPECIDIKSNPNEPGVFDRFSKYLNKTTWEGWIVKSAITSIIEIDGYVW